MFLGEERAGVLGAGPNCNMEIPAGRSSMLRVSVLFWGGEGACRTAPLTKRDIERGSKTVRANEPTRKASKLPAHLVLLGDK